MTRRIPVVLMLLGLGCSSRRDPDTVAAAQPSAPQGRQAQAFKPPSSPNALAALAAARHVENAPADEVFLKNMGQFAQPRRPVTVSRFFARGEIAGVAQAVVEGKPVETQCDVKTRWDDGSLQHALVTFVADFGPAARVPVRFANRTAEASPDAGLDKPGMLALDWGAAMTISVTGQEGPDEVTVDARKILAAWDGASRDVRYWMRGPLATQVILEAKPGSPLHSFGWKASGGGVRLAEPMRRGVTTLTVNQEGEQIAAAWTMPLLAYVDTELVEICSVQGRKLTVCPQGRGKNGITAAESNYMTVLPQASWERAREEQHKSLHPMFVLTFYRGWPGVKVEYIMENVWSNRLQDQIYDTKLLRGKTLEVAKQRHDRHIAATRWREALWSGTEPGRVHIDHNFAYLVHSRALPSYDLTRRVPEGAVREEIELFERSDRGAGMGSAQWEKVFEAPGARGDIALLPRWYVRYLYTFDPRLEAVMLGNAEAGAHVPIHFRESLAGKSFCARTCTGPSPDALGRVVSLDARPTVHFRDSGDVIREERIQWTGLVTYGGWMPDQAHQPSFAYVPYLLTGDWYWLEEIQFWAAYCLAGHANVSLDCDYCRHADWGYLYGETRGRAWALRTLAHAALMSPIGSPEKEYFTAKLNNTIAVNEGQFNITGGSFQEPCPATDYRPATATRWCWGNRTWSYARSNPLFGFDRPGVAGPATEYGFMWSATDLTRLRTAKPPNGLPAHGVSSEWMVNFHFLATGHVLELGFTQIAELHSHTILRLLGQLQSPEYNPYLVAAYRTPLFRCDPKPGANGKFDCAYGTPFQTWAEVLAAYKDKKDMDPNDPSMHRGSKEFPPAHANSPEGYTFIAQAAASYLPGINYESWKGQAAWEWIHSRLDQNVLNMNPAFAFVPRKK